MTGKLVKDKDRKEGNRPCDCDYVIKAALPITGKEGGVDNVPGTISYLVGKLNPFLAHIIHKFNHITEPKTKVVKTSSKRSKYFLRHS